jgi:hypothetical protein
MFACIFENVIVFSIVQNASRRCTVSCPSLRLMSRRAARHATPLPSVLGSHEAERQPYHAAPPLQVAHTGAARCSFRDDAPEEQIGSIHSDDAPFSFVTAFHSIRQPRRSFRHILSLVHRIRPDSHRLAHVEMIIGAGLGFLLRGEGSGTERRCPSGA